MKTNIYNSSTKSNSNTINSIVDNINFRKKLNTFGFIGIILSIMNRYYFKISTNTDTYMLIISLIFVLNCIFLRKIYKIYYNKYLYKYKYLLKSIYIYSAYASIFSLSFCFTDIMLDNLIHLGVIK